MRKKRINAPRQKATIPLICGYIVSAIGVIVLLGWALNIDSLKSFVPGFSVMNPVSAINFILFGIWLCFKNKRGFNPTNYIAGLIILVNALILIPKFTELISPTGLIIDSLFVQQSIGDYRIASATAVNFLLLTMCFGIAFSSLKNKEFLHQNMVIVCLAISSIYLCSYVFNYNSLIGASVLTPMALPTCLSFISLCIGLLFIYPDKGYIRPLISKKTGGKMARNTLPLLVIVSVIIGALGIQGEHFKLYNSEFGAALYVVVFAVLSFVLTCYFAKKINEIDGLRKHYEDELLEKSNQLLKSDFLLEQISGISKIGGWEITYPDQKLSYTRQVYGIMEIPLDKELSFDDFFNSYTPEFTNTVLEHYNKALIDGNPYELEAKLITAKGREIWVKIKAQPVFGDADQIIAMRGTIQDMDESKEKELLYRQSTDIINDQNAKLKNFTQVVSHNLRTHAGNIKSTLSIYEEEECEEEKTVILKMMNRAADSLNQTIANLK